MTPQTPSLDGCFAKLDRAAEHLDQFKDEARQLLESVVHTTAFETVYDPDVPRFLVHVVQEPMTSFRLSTIAGDFVHNLRSSLDHLAYQLLVLAGNPWDRTEWPIVADLSKIDGFSGFKGLRERLVDAGRSDLWTKVEHHQYHNYVQGPPTGDVDLLTQRYRDVPVAVLHDLSNRDKHRLLLEPYFNIDSFTRIEPVCVRDCENPKPIKDWGLWFTLRKDAAPIVQFTADITGPDPVMRVIIEFTPRPVRFLDIPDEADTYLELMADAVRFVLEDFRPDFC